MKTNKFFNKCFSWVRNHSSDILWTIGITAGAVGIGCCMAETPEASKKIEERKKELGVEKLPPLEVIKTGWKCFPKTFIAETVSILCLCGEKVISHKTNKGLTAALAVSDVALANYRSAVAANIGEAAERKLAAPILAEKSMKTSEALNSPIISVNTENLIWCQDGVTGRRFWKTKEIMNRAINLLNHDIPTEGRVSYNTFLYYIDEESCDLCDDFGWDGSYMYNTVLEYNTRPGNFDRTNMRTPTIIEFNVDPKRYL